MTNSDGTCVRDYLHVLDLAAGHLLALEALEDSSNFKGWESCTSGRFRAYNLGRGQGFSVLDILGAMRKATGFDFKFEIVGRRKGDVPYLIGEPTLAQKELGFSAPQDLDAMCRDLWNWQLRNPQGLSGPYISGELPTPSSILTSTNPVTNGTSTNGHVTASA